ncbi:MAG TPA: 50S ribosomal protein L30 [Membranihabitans sp.]|nr:50S ribosomal protein L30 [Membranihabitans sp.]
MSKVKIRQVRSAIDRSLKQKRTLKALGLTKINGTVEHELNDTIRGMIFKVSHLIEVEELDGSQDSPKPVQTQEKVQKPVVAAQTIQEEE